MADPETFRLDTLVPASLTVRPDEPPDGSAPPGALPRLALGDGGLVRERTLGEGGMGRVVLARDEALGREVAVKEAKHPTPRAVAALLHEARMMGGLEHPNVIPVHALGLGPDGAPRIVMKRVEGWTWEELLDAPDHPGWRAWPGATDPLERDVEVLGELCRALQFAHERGVVHRDLKPANAMIGRHGEVYLLDFGVAARVGTDARQAAGTPSYLAPEMTAPGEVRPSMDVFLVGATLTRVLAGAPRNGGGDLEAVMARAAACAPFAWPPGVDPELAALADRACAKDPADRPGSVAEIGRALRAWRVHRGAVKLASAARERLAALEAALEAGDPAGRASAFAEARFGFREALAQWDHPAAREGLARALERGARDAIRREADLDAAEVWLEELRALGAPTDALRAELGQARRAVDARRELEREADIQLGAAERGASFLIVFAASVGLVGAIASGAVDGSTPRGALRIALAWAALYGGLAFIGRRWVFANRASRALAVAAASITGAMLANRVAAVRFDLPLFWMYAVDLLLIALPLIALGSFFGAELVVFGALNLAGFAALCAFPEHALAIFGVAVSVSPLALTRPALAAWRART